MAALLTYLESELARDFAWNGIDDCAGFVARWVQICTGKDAAATVRGRYRTALGAARYAKRHGGFAAAAALAFDSLLARTRDPRDGDVAVVATPDGEALAIRVQGLWVAKAARGEIARDWPVVICWRVG